MNKSEKAIPGYKAGNDLPKGCNQFRSIINNGPSLDSDTGTNGWRNIGSLISIPNRSRIKILAGVFCLNIPTTDKGLVQLSLIIINFCKTNQISVNTGNYNLFSANLLPVFRHKLITPVQVLQCRIMI